MRYPWENNSSFSVAILFVGMLLLSSCGSSKPKVIISKEAAQKQATKNSYKNTNSSSEAIIKPKKKQVSKIIKDAQKFKGTKYRYGGTTKRGMDCSGLIYVAFTKNNIPLPRTSRAMSLEGDRIYLEEVRQGDLLFFGTNKNSNIINHVGLVVDHTKDGIYFIHSTTSSGVITSSLSQRYWENNFVMARRIL